MARLKEYNGHYCESEYEYAFIGFLEAEDWIYSSGNNISRVTKRDVLIADDFKKFISDTNSELTEDEVTQIFDNVRLVGSESDFATLHKVYGWMVDGVQFTPQDGLARMIPLIDFENWDKNIFRVVNQFTVEYTNNGQKENRRPDVLLFVNGIPLCVIELKNPADANATIYDAWEQINIRYWRDIPHLLHYCPLACISDGVKTRLGSVRTPYEHFYAWRRVNDGDTVSTLPFEETETMIKGVYAPERFLEIFRDYIYFQDSIYDSDEVEIVCRYPQFFAARLLKQSIINSVVQKSGKGGTYFGATGCGKTYTMAFLARQLALRCTDIPEIGSPTIILIVDRDELQKQGAKLFTKSMEFLNLGEVSVVKNRAQLRQELGARQSGGFYICTIQKFCDREDDKIGLINNRQNIICFSDEAHRTQLEHSKKIQFSKDADENMKAMVSKPYAKVLKEAFPQATFVGFTGTPIAETYQTFGDEIDRYTMDQAVADGLTVSIKYHPRIAKVLLDKVKVKEIEDYYKKCADDGATYEDIEASKKAMSSMEVILGEPSRLERLATDIHDHYISSCAGDPDRIQKAMVVCSNRKIAYGPLESYANRSVRLAVLSPRECAADIWRHLNELNKHHATTLKQDKAFLPEYIGFQDVFRFGLNIPNGNDTKRFKGYSLSDALKASAEEFFNGICRYIDVMEREKHEFDVLVIYIPNQLSKMRELKNENVYFDLHDSLKIYCAGKGIVTQIIEERSVHTNSDMAKIMWGLSTAIYIKAIGKLWKPKITRYDTAYIGLSYVQSIKNNEKISIGCSQLFDSEGNGMELYLRPLKDPQIIQKNPYMRSGDACRLMNNLKRIYDESVPLHKLNRIVIHKTTHFTKEEMEGITKGLAGVDNIELLQIQEFSAWRAIRFQNDVATPFPIQRGTVIPLDKDTFLIWTHGSVQHDQLAGKKLNYYKNGRGIPAPLLVKRFMGKSSALELVNEILMLTKMNWNSGDGLYKILPVTLDFAKALSRVAKQDLVVYDRPYDFRYFM